MLRKSKLSRKDRIDILVQLGRYERECGEVVVTRVDPAIFAQAPVAVVPTTDVVAYYAENGLHANA